jgi:hypothetical protein
MTSAEVKRVNAAIKRLASRLDRFELLCARNNSPLRGVYFTNNPKWEYSDFEVKWRKEKRKRRLR